jgi:hypothetical protein
VDLECLLSYGNKRVKKTELKDKSNKNPKYIMLENDIKLDFKF